MHMVIRSKMLFYFSAVRRPAMRYRPRMGSTFIHLIVAMRTGGASARFPRQSRGFARGYISSHLSINLTIILSLSLLLVVVVVVVVSC